MSGYYSNQPYAQSSGQMYGTNEVSSPFFNTAPIFGGNSTYYDTAGNGQAGYERYVQGVTGGQAGGRFGTYLRNNFFNQNNAYGAAQGQDPSLTFTQYLQNNQGDMQRQYGEQSMAARGEQGQRAVKWL